MSNAATISGLSSAPSFSAYASGNQTISNTSWTKVTLGIKVFDTASCFSSSRFTPNVPGYYQINCVIRFGASSNASRFIVGVWKNGGEYARPAEPYFSSAIMPQGQYGGSVVVYLNGTTDYIELYGYINGSGTLQFQDDGSQPYTSSMTGCLIRGA